MSDVIWAVSRVVLPVVLLVAVIIALCAALSEAEQRHCREVAHRAWPILTADQLDWECRYGDRGGAR